MKAEDVVSAVVDAYNAEHMDVVSVAQVMCRGRSRELVDCRQMSCYILRHKYGIQFAKIGAMLALDHATCVHACKQVANRVEAELRYACVLSRALDALNNIEGIPEDIDPVERMSYERMRTALRMERKLHLSTKSDLIRVQGDLSKARERITELKDEVARLNREVTDYVEPSNWTPEQRKTLNELLKTNR